MGTHLRNLMIDQKMILIIQHKPYNGAMGDMGQKVVTHMRKVPESQHFFTAAFKNQIWKHREGVLNVFYLIY